MKHTNRFIALLLVALLLMTTACSGNGGNSGTNSQSTNTSQSTNNSQSTNTSTANTSQGTESTADNSGAEPAPSEGPEKWELPIAPDKVTLTCFSVLDGKASVSLSSMEENFTVQYYEELSNVHISFQHPSSATTITEALNNMFVSGQLTDIIFNIQSATDGIDALIENGFILRLNEPIDKWGYYYNEVFKANPAFKASVTTYDGNIGHIHLGVILLSQGKFRPDLLDSLSGLIPRGILHEAKELIASESAADTVLTVLLHDVTHYLQDAVTRLMTVSVVYLL